MCTQAAARAACQAARQAHLKSGVLAEHEGGEGDAKLAQNDDHDPEVAVGLELIGDTPVAASMEGGGSGSRGCVRVGEKGACAQCAWALLCACRGDS